jgi:hypothetical protein
MRAFLLVLCAASVHAATVAEFNLSRSIEAPLSTIDLWEPFSFGFYGPGAATAKVWSYIGMSGTVASGEAVVNGTDGEEWLRALMIAPVSGGTDAGVERTVQVGPGGGEITGSLSLSASPRFIPSWNEVVPGSASATIIIRAEMFDGDGVPVDAYSGMAQTPEPGSLAVVVLAVYWIGSVMKIWPSAARHGA